MKSSKDSRKDLRIDWSLMPTTIKSGTQVLCVEGAHKGEHGTVTTVARRYDEDSQQTTKMVTFETDKGKRVTTRLSWVREV